MTMRMKELKDFIQGMRNSILHDLSIQKHSLPYIQRINDKVHKAVTYAYELGKEEQDDINHKRIRELTTKIDALTKERDKLKKQVKKNGLK